MKERLLQYIWQFQYFNRDSLTTTGGEPLQIISAGSFNTNQGPDFLSARICIGRTVWAGNVELHVHASDWDLHRHAADSNYSNIILHVVWHHDAEITGKDGIPVPALELQSRVSGLLLSRYAELMKVSLFIPCERQITKVSDLVLTGWKQRLLVERLQKKSAAVLERLEKSNFHWEEMFWWMLARNFGAKINSEAFESIARSIPVNILAKHKNQIHQIEALLFGQAGLLQQKWNDDYPIMLQKEFIFLTKKYKLTLPDARLFFLRMRPANFPTVRLAQLAMLIHFSHHLFSKIKEAVTPHEIRVCFTATANDYWHYHYTFDEAASFSRKNIGRQMVDNIFVNTIIPVLFTFGQYHNEQSFKDRAVNWLMEISPEKNAVTKGFEDLGLSNISAFDSQSFIQLKNEYCDKRRCLECAVGNAVLKAYT